MTAAGGLEVSVVGAGIGGLAAAIALNRAGFSVTVHEQASAFARVGAGINLTPNASTCLFHLGLGEAVERVAVAPPYRLSRTWDTGAVTSRVELGERAREDYGAPFLQLHRGDLHAAMVEAAGGIKLELDRQLTGYEVLPDGDVELAFASGPPTRADVVIAADGIHSRVREQMLGPERPHFTGRVAYRGVIPVEAIAADGVDPYVKWWGPDRHVVVYRISGGTECYFVTSVPEPSWQHESWSSRGDVSELREAFGGFHDHVQAVLAACEVTYKWALLERAPLPRWMDRGPVIMIGDACHPMVPYMAQGAATSLEDAVVLARCLTGAADPDSVMTALRRFQGHRLARTARIQNEARENRWLRYDSDPRWVYGYDATSASWSAEG
ncbi:MAG: 2-polyprenyl-6-methoxyphenol hydroxylase-like oxidoreductase [Streptosporangiaceae bacterium]|nr:2-polyprenyl-6-methoxyphenol hydroxylase-like oxidoreductase [Streptosporangiaceae bacterium]